jgi:hypothetical protein
MEPHRFNYPKGFLEHVCYLFCLLSLWSLCAIYLHTDICTCMYVRTYTHQYQPFGAFWRGFGLYRKTRRPVPPFKTVPEIQKPNKSIFAPRPSTSMILCMLLTQTHRSASTIVSYWFGPSVQNARGAKKQVFGLIIHFFLI